MHLYEAFVAGLLILIPTIYVAVTRRKARPLPPGPAGLPILGNLFDVPKGNAYKKYQELSRQYGASSVVCRCICPSDITTGSDIISLKLPGTTIIVLSSTEIARELVDKRSSIYSDRCAYSLLRITQSLNAA